jgi:DNA-binding response OmpR family regulator
MTPAAQRERVLVVDEDKDIRNLLGEQILAPLGHVVTSASDAGEAMQHATKSPPDLIIASLTLPGLNGKDLLVALRAQGITAPVLMTGTEGMEVDALQAFRLGAHDFLLKPLRETEVVAAVERALEDIRLRRERQALAEQLADSTRQLESRTRELATLHAIGKAVAASAKLDHLLDRIIEGAVYAVGADLGWILLQKGGGKQLVLHAQRNLPVEMAQKLGQVWDDGISSLVMLSGESIRMHGDALAKFGLGMYCQSVLLTPVKVQDRPAGVINVGRRMQRPFRGQEQAILETMADYVSIAWMKVGLFDAQQEQADRQDQTTPHTAEVSQHEMRPHFVQRVYSIRSRLAGIASQTREEQTREALQSAIRSLEELMVWHAETPKSEKPVPRTPPFTITP